MSQPYNDFLSELLSQSYSPSGIAKEPDETNDITASRYNLQNELQKMSEDGESPLHEVARGFANRNKANIQRYVATKGEIPSENIDELCMQAHRLRKHEINQFAEILGTSPENAEIYLEDSESRAKNISSPEADSFLGEIFGAIEQAVKPALDKAAAKRAQKGKKPGILGYLDTVVNQNKNVNDIAYDAGAAGSNIGNSLKGVLGDVYQGIVDQEKKRQINKMLPVIIIALVVIILVTVLIARKK